MKQSKHSKGYFSTYYFTLVCPQKEYKNVKYKIYHNYLKIIPKFSFYLFCIQEEITENNSYLYESYSSGRRYSVKIRATDAGFCLVSPDWGEWSTPVEFGKNKNPFLDLVLLLPVCLIFYFMLTDGKILIITH